MIERSMYLGGFDWAKMHSPPIDVRNYVKEILFNIIDIQAEVSYLYLEQIVQANIIVKKNLF